MSNSLEDLDPHNYFGRVAPPNNETTPMGVTETPKVIYFWYMSPSN